MSLENNKRYIISQLGDDYHDAGGYEMRYRCPFCEDLGLRNDDYKLYINYSDKKAGIYWCHRCEATGRIHLDPLVAKGSSTEVYNYLQNYLNDLQGPTEEESDYFLIPSTPPDIGSMAFNYLISRGIGIQDMIKYNIRVSHSNDDPRFYGRIIIPNRVISNKWTDLYVARTYLGDPVRYKNPSSSKSHSLVFNLHNIPDNPDDIIINEGVINSIIAGEDSVATYGKHVSDLQIREILRKKPKSIYVSLDYDARDVAEKLCRRLYNLTEAQIYIIDLPDGKDASDLGKQDYRELMKSSIVYRKPSIYSIENLISNMRAK